MISLNNIYEYEKNYMKINHPLFYFKLILKILAKLLNLKGSSII